MGTTYDLTQTTPTELKKGDIINIPYSGAAKSITLPKGVYKLEVWGGQGGTYSSYNGGRGGYSYGLLSIEADTLLYCYVGGQPATNSTTRTATSGGFNGGGNGYNRYYKSTYTYGQGGGGATDFRIATDSLYARVIVAGGGGGSASADASTTKYGGGTSGGSPQSSYAASQTGAGTNGSFGTGGAATTDGSNYKYGSGGGGGGWYGGGACSSYSDSTDYTGYNGGGSGYVYTSSTASNYPSGCLLNSAYYLTDAATIAGNTSFLSPTGTSETGHTGNGYARITVVRMNLPLKVKTDTEWKEASDIWCKRRETLTPVTYIQSTGTQYIDTGFKPNQNTRIIVDMDVTAADAQSALFGARNSYQNNGFALHTWQKNAGYQIDYATNASNVTTVTSSGRHTIDFNGNVLTVDDTVINTYTEATFQCNYTALIFSVHTGDSHMMEKFPTKAKLYSCKIYDNNTLVRDFVPCMNDSGVGCLYDKVNQVCYYNNGTGDFIVGSTKRELPSAYTQVEYIQSTGTQYIDTDVVCDNSSLYEVEFSCVPNGDSIALMGCQVTSSIRTMIVWFYNGYIYFSSGSDYSASSDCKIAYTSGTKYTGKFTINASAKTINATVNGTVLPTYTYAGTLDTSNTVYLLNNNGQSGQNFIGQLDYIKIKKDGELTRDYIPVTANDGAIVGMYDFVTKVCYISSGSGTFIAGDAVNITETATEFQNSQWVQGVSMFMKQSDTVVPLTHIQSTGTQYINTGYYPSGKTFRVVAKFKYPVSHDNLALFGNNTTGQFAITVWGSQPTFWVGTSSGITCGEQTSLDTEYVLDVTADNGTLTAIWNDTTYTTTYTGSLYTGQPMYIFGSNKSNTVAETDSGYILYYIKFYDGGELVRSYVPVLDENNEACLMDAVTNQLYYNAGTGVFQYDSVPPITMKREYWTQIF